MRYLTSNLFDSRAQTLVNPVNTDGVMGAGLAQAFRARYPEMYRQYRERCRRGDFSIGSLDLWCGPDRWVLNLPTKTSWREPSNLDYVRRGLLQFRAEYQALGIRSVAFRLGRCSIYMGDMGDDEKIPDKEPATGRGLPWLKRWASAREPGVGWRVISSHSVEHASLPLTVDRNVSI